MVAFPYLLLPQLWSTRNRAKRRERGDLTRAGLFGGVGAAVFAALFAGAFWLAWQLEDYAELSDYLLRLGMSWLFVPFSPSSCCASSRCPTSPIFSRRSGRR